MGDKVSKKQSQCTLCGCKIVVDKAKIDKTKVDKAKVYKAKVDKTFVKAYGGMIQIEDLGKTLERPNRPKRPTT